MSIEKRANPFQGPLGLNKKTRGISKHIKDLKALSILRDLAGYRH